MRNPKVVLARTGKAHEIKCEKKSVEYGKALGYAAYKMQFIGRRGCSDYLFLSPTGVHVWIEFKMEGKGLRASQKEIRDEFLARGAHYYGPVDSLEEARRILEFHADA